MRRLVAAVVSATAVAGLWVAVDPAAADASSAGAYTAVTPRRVLDTRGASAVGARETVTVGVAGSGRPAPLGVSSVAVILTAAGGTKGGFVTAYAGGSKAPAVSNLSYGIGPTISNSSVVPVSSAGTITLYNGSPGSVDLVLDVSGYYSGGTVSQSQQGAFGVVTPARLADTRATTAVKAGGSLRVAVEGRAGVPAGASAALLDLTAIAGTKGGFVTAFATGTVRPATTSLSYGVAANRAVETVAQTGSDGSVTLYNGSTGTVQLTVDVQGYYTPGDPLTPGALGVLPPARALSARTVPSKGTYTLPLAGVVGVPRAQVSAAPLAVTVAHPASAGFLATYAGTTRPNISNLSFAVGQQVSSLVMAPLSSSGSVTFYNGSAGAITLYVDVLGYVGAAALTPPATTTSRYVSSLAAISGTGSGSEGCLDGASGTGLVLLDIGAQTITPNQNGSENIGPNHPGVKLVFTPDASGRYAYATLVNALDVYLTEFARCAPTGHTARVAIGTNNSGAFSGTTAYAATTRGTDWANQVVLPLRQRPNHAAITVVGALDLEAGFASTEMQAEQWITNFLHDGSLTLINNGSADNCPTTYGSAAECGSVRDENAVAKTWTRAQYVRLSYGLAPGRISVLPQIYLAIPDQAAQWANIQATAGGKLTFEGSLTQRGQCQCGQTATQAWAALRHAQSLFTTTPNLPVATDLQPN